MHFEIHFFMYASQQHTESSRKTCLPSHSVETHTLSLHIRHTEKRLIPDTERDDSGTSGATTIAFRPSKTVSFSVYIQTGLSGKRSCPSSTRQPRLLYSPIRHLSGKGGKVADYYFPSSSSFFLRVVLRFFGFSSAGLSTFTPANSGSIRIRPQYSQTMIFLCIFTSS